MSLKSEKIRQYVIENGLDLTTIPNKLVRQIAQILDMKPNTVKSTLQRLRSQRSTYRDPPQTTQTVIRHEAPPPTTTQPPPIHWGQFYVRENKDGTADLYCPNCGLYEPSYPLPTVEKPVEVVKEVEVIPPGYMKIPKCGRLSEALDLHHMDNDKPVDECPDCARDLLSWFNQHKTRLEKTAGVKKSDIIDGIIEAIAIGAGIYEALNRLPRPTGTQPNPVTASLQPLNLKI